MSYLGKVALKSSDIRRFDVTSSTSATHTLTWTPPNELSLIVTINGVKQHEDAYSVSGVTLTLTSALVAEDKLEVIGINDIGTTITPAQGSVDTDQLANVAVTTAKIEDDAVTADKLANSINTEITANTAKVTNATHTGDVTGATALTIAVDAVDIAMLSATGSASSSTFLRGDNAWAAVGKVLQVVVQSTISTGSFANTSGVVMSQSFTPTESSSKVLVMLHINCEKAGSAGTYASLTIRRDASSIGEALNTVQYQYTPGSRQPIGTFIYDSPATSSAVTYDLYHTNVSGTDTYSYGHGVASLVMMEIDV